MSKPDGTNGKKPAKPVSVAVVKTTKLTREVRHAMRVRDQNNKTMRAPRGTERAQRRYGMDDGMAMLPAKNPPVVLAATHSFAPSPESVRLYEQARKAKAKAVRHFSQSDEDNNLDMKALKAFITPKVVRTKQPRSV